MKITPSCVSFLAALVATSSPIAAEVNSLRSVQVPEVEGEVTADAVLAETTWEVVDEPVNPTVDGAGLPNADQLVKSAKDLPGFTYVGQGRCLDEHDNYYTKFSSPSLSFDAAVSVNYADTVAALCAQYCLQNPTPEFVGTEASGKYVPPNPFVSYRCNCLYSVALPEGIDGNSFAPPSSGPFNGSTGGRGKIKYSDRNNLSRDYPHQQCYKYDPPTQSTTTSPTTRPSTTSPTSPTRRADGQSCPMASNKSCQSNACICGTCGHKQPSRKKCSTDANCLSGNCKSKSWWSPTLGCNGRCR